MAAVSLNKTKLKEGLKEATGTKGKELDAALATLLQGCVETKTSEPSLVRIK